MINNFSLLVTSSIALGSENKLNDILCEFLVCFLVFAGVHVWVRARFILIQSV